MEKYTLNQQIGILKNSRGGSHLRIAQVWVGLFALGLLAATLYTQHMAFFMLFLFFAVVAVFGGSSIKHINHAVEALESGRKTTCSVWIEQSVDSNNFYFAKVDSGDSQVWEFSFRPDGWHPAEGQCAAQAYYLERLAWPVLVVAEDGIMVPDSQPTLKSAA